MAEQRAEIRRLRKQNFRQSIALSKNEIFRAAVKVDNFALPLPQSEAQCIFSTNSIAVENMGQASHRLGLQVSSGPASSMILYPALLSIFPDNR